MCTTHAASICGPTLLYALNNILHPYSLNLQVDLLPWYFMAGGRDQPGAARSQPHDTRQYCRGKCRGLAEVGAAVLHSHRCNDRLSA